jgi:hypothetical protein
MPKTLPHRTRAHGIRSHIHRPRSTTGRSRFRSASRHSRPPAPPPQPTARVRVSHPAGKMTLIPTSRPSLKCPAASSATTRTSKSTKTSRKPFDDPGAVLGAHPLRLCLREWRLWADEHQRRRRGQYGLEPAPTSPKSSRGMAEKRRENNRLHLWRQPYEELAFAELDPTSEPL